MYTYYRQHRQHDLVVEKIQFGDCNLTSFLVDTFRLITVQLTKKHVLTHLEIN